MQDLKAPQPNTQALSWFYGEDKKGTLLLKAKYQRNPIWSIGQKCFLIDSLISKCPIPQVFINIRTEGSSKERKTIYEVVDGQQRLRAIIEYMNDEWPLIATTARSYPVSSAYKPHIGKRYSDLPSEVQDSIWNYSLAVQELRGWSDLQIRSLFRRLNYVVEKLNNQELRHSQYFGEFVEAVESLAKEKFWDEVDFFSRSDSQRMRDIEFVSELFVILIDGVQEGQSTLDKFYADYDVVFPKRTTYITQFKKVLNSLRSITAFLAASRFTKKADFYGLFAATAKLCEESREVVKLSERIAGLKRLDKALNKPSGQLVGDARKYYQTVIEGPNKKAKREQRMEILYNLLCNK